VGWLGHPAVAVLDGTLPANLDSGCYEVIDARAPDRLRA
jgi:hypothetical protein